ncbi:MAG: hypothetical protein L3J03_08210 [Desulfobacterales bacterium]|nr:hypothetical protein [Desulfobacterales bacterium]
MHKHAIKAEKRKFAFLIHPREGKDLGRFLGKKTGIGEETGVRMIPEGAARLVLKFMRAWRGPVVCSRFHVSNTVEGYIVGLPMTAREMLALPNKYVARQIKEAVLFSQNHLGVERVGLGAYTAPMSLNGLSVIRDSRVTCAITHGDGLSAASAVPVVQQAAALRGIDIRQCIIAVVGAYGLVGRADAILLSELEPAGMVLTGPNRNKLKKVAREMSGFQGEIVCSTDNDAVRGADILLLCTSAVGDVAGPDMLKKGAVVVDMAQPHNMGPEVCRARPDVLRVDGGFMTVPGMDIGFNMGPPTGTTYACLTETMVSTLAGDKEHHVGPVDMDFARKIMGQAREFGFAPAPMTNFAKPVSGSPTINFTSPERPAKTPLDANGS